MSCYSKRCIYLHIDPAYLTCSRKQVRKLDRPQHIKYSSDMHRREALLHIDHRFNEHTYRDKRNHFDEGYPPSFVTRHTRRLRTQLCERRQHFTVAGKPAGTRGRGGEPSPAAASQGRNYSAGSDQSRPKIPSEHFERGLFVFQVYAALLGPRGPSNSTRRACCYLAGPWGPSGRGSVPNSRW